MISLKFQQRYRSIVSFPSTDLPDFAVITGLNGAGKTHLLEAIQRGAIVMEGITNAQAQIRYFDWQTMVPKPPEKVRRSGAMAPSNESERERYLSSAKTHFQRVCADVRMNLERLGIPRTLDGKGIAQLTPTTANQLKPPQLGNTDTWPSIVRVLKNAEANCFGAIGNNAIIKAALTKRAEQEEIPVCYLSGEQIEDSFPLSWEPTDIFQQNFTQIFSGYYHADEQNKFREFQNKEYGTKLHVFSPLGFKERFGEPPWEFVNRLLEQAHLNYLITQPTPYSKSGFEAKLVDKETGIEISFQDLSSGEKIIMSFALCLYGAKYKSVSVQFPKVLLLDEVDAPLHPSMVKDVLRIIEEVLVKEVGLKVILTTHSPSTVALSPEGALFRLERNTHKLEPCSREQAVQALTSGYISVSESTRYIITEAKRDSVFYTALFRKLTAYGRLASVPNLVFLQASDKKDRDGGGCAQVRNWAEKLTQSGIKQIQGLIDRDAINGPTGIVKVIQRYSLENYLLDPVVVYAVLMHRGEHMRLYDAGIADRNFYELQKLTDAQLQQIADSVCNLVEAKSPEVCVVPKARFDVQYIADRAISLPTWMRDYRGHDLVSAFRKAFQECVGKEFVITRNDCSDMVEMITERLPGLIPIELATTLQELQK